MKDHWSMLRKGPCLLTLVVCALAHSSKTWAGELEVALPTVPAVARAPAAKTPTDAFLPPVQFSIPVVDAFSADEFRPRKRTQAKPEVADYGSGDPMFRSTTVWQRLNDFRARDKVRVLTLWEMGGSNLSLQAGRKGDPWLQWSSSWTGRSKVSSGLLDRVLAASLSGMANRNHAASHYSPASSTPPIPLITTAVPAAK